MGSNGPKIGVIVFLLLSFCRLSNVRTGFLFKLIPGVIIIPHFVLVTSAESYHGLDNWQKTEMVAEKDSGQCMDVGEHERHYGFGMDALVTVRSRNTNLIMVLARVLW